MFARHVVVPLNSVYPGNAKNSIETLSRDGSTVTADVGATDGTENVVVVCANDVCTTFRNNRYLRAIPIIRKDTRS